MANTIQRMFTMMRTKMKISLIISIPLQFLSRKRWKRQLQLALLPRPPSPSPPPPPRKQQKQPRQRRRRVCPHHRGSTWNGNQIRVLITRPPVVVQIYFGFTSPQRRSLQKSWENIAENKVNLFSCICSLDLMRRSDVLRSISGMENLVLKCFLGFAVISLLVGGIFLLQKHLRSTSSNSRSYRYSEANQTIKPI